MDIEERFWNKIVLTEDGCWEWLGALHKNGYSAFYGPGKKCVYGHRYSYSLFVGKIPRGLDLDHLCRNRACVNPAHLEPVTRSVNLKRGKTGKTKFKAKDIVKIRELYLTGEYSQYDLADMFNTNQGYITHIINRNVWDHV